MSASLHGGNGFHGRYHVLVVGRLLSYAHIGEFLVWLPIDDFHEPVAHDAELLARLAEPGLELRAVRLHHRLFSDFVDHAHDVVIREWAVELLG
jgi:hypothetical protein